VHAIGRVVFVEDNLSTLVPARLQLARQGLELLSAQIGEYGHAGQKIYVDHVGYLPVTVTATVIISPGLVDEAWNQFGSLKWSML
jgi:hypothetical protein